MRGAWLTAILPALMTLAFGGYALADTALAGGTSMDEDRVSAAASWVDWERLRDLPAPVARYFRLVLSDGQPIYRQAHVEQEGTVRTSTKTENWMPFTAVQTFLGDRPGFTWEATMQMAPLVRIHVSDSYTDGVGEGRVRLWSWLPMGHDRGTPEMNSGSLHRYLAEAVWCPTALWPREGLRWTAIDDTRALATLSDHGITVSLAFRFNAAGEVVGVFSPGRWGSFEGGYRQVAWEGHFRDYHEQDGMRIPRYGEVGWYDSGVWQPVWKGTIRRAAFITGRSDD